MQTIDIGEDDMYTQIIDELAAKGRSSFTSEDIEKLTNSSPEAIKEALRRLQKKGHLVMPHRGFYLILSPEHRARGCLPPEQFIPELMDYLKETYYVGLLSAAEYYGAAHQRPQEFQVIVAKSRRPIICGKVRVNFIYRKNVNQIPTTIKNTPAGTVKISTPEVTALDLIGYVRHSGGLDNVATVLAELAEHIDPAKLIEVAKLSPISWVQRLGYLFDLLGKQEMASALGDYLGNKHPVPIALMPNMSMKGSSKNSRWQLYVNTSVEPEI